MSQQWPSICDVHVKGLGRGVVTTTKVEKGEILVDYHGEEIKGMSCEEYLDIPGNQSDYLFQISQKHLVDASKEICDEHPNNRCLGRLINHVVQGSECEIGASKYSTEQRRPGDGS